MLRMIAESLITKIKALFKSLWTDDSGNVEVGKNLVVDGTIQQNTWELDQGIDVDASLPQTAKDKGFVGVYGHARVSGGKLNIVLVFKCVHPNADWEGGLGSIRIPLTTKILAKLFPSIGNSLSIETKGSTLINDSGFLASTNIQNALITQNLVKASDGIVTDCYAIIPTDFSPLNNYEWRFETNFILS